MSVDAYVGLPGAGKSHGVVLSVILPALKAGRRVVHNMPLDEAGIRKIETDGELVAIPQGQGAADFVDWFRNEHAGALLVLDEAWRYWASGTKASAIPEDQREFFAMHRHLTGQTSDGRTTDVALVSQNLAQLAQFLRDLVEQTFHYVKLTSVGFTKGYRCDVYSGAVTGSKPPESRRLNSYRGEYQKHIFECYKSHTLSTNGHAGTEDKADKRGNILRRPYVIAAAICVVLILPMFLVAKHSFFAVAHGKAGAPDAERSESGASAKPAPVAVPPKPSGPKYSDRWRYAGEITRHGLIVAVLESPTGPRFLQAAACTMDAAGNATCMIDGEIVNQWSGVPPRDAIGTFVAASSTPQAVAEHRP